MSRTSPPTAERPAGLGGRVRGAVRTLNPGYLALVMATGIISVAMSEHGVPGLSLALLWLAAACYVVLVVLYAWRLVSYRADVGRDLRDPARAFGFFTIVAGTDVLGTRLAADGRHLTAFALLAAASAAWLVLVYLIPWLATLNGHGHVLAEVNGTWFIWAVSTQSLAVLSATLEPTVQTGRAALAFLAVFCWSVGIFLYGAAAVFVAARILSYGLSPRDLTPPYWVAMGATAITVLAGARPRHGRHPAPDRRLFGAVLGVRHLAVSRADRGRGVAAHLYRTLLREPPVPSAFTVAEPSGRP